MNEPQTYDGGTGAKVRAILLDDNGPPRACLEGTLGKRWRGAMIAMSH